MESEKSFDMCIIFLFLELDNIYWTKNSAIAQEE